MMKFFSNLAFAELFTVVESYGKIRSLRFRFQTAWTHSFSSIDTFSTGSGLLMLGLASFTFLTHGVGVKSLRVTFILKDSLTNVLKIFVVVVLIEGIFFEWSIFVLYGAFVTIHTLSFKLILIIKIQK